MVVIGDRRAKACASLLRGVHAITGKEGITPSALHAIMLKLVALAKRQELFPLSDFAMPDAQGRNHPLLVEENEGHGLYLTIGLPGKEAAPHDHGIWCVNAAGDVPIPVEIGQVGATGWNCHATTACLSRAGLTACFA